MNGPAGLSQMLASEHLVPSLVHTLWQAGLAAAVLELVLLWLPGRRAQLRYALSLSALAAVVAAWLITWNVLEYAAHEAPPANQQEASVAAGSPPALAAAPIETDGPSALDPDAEARRLPNTWRPADANPAWSIREALSIREVWSIVAMPRWHAALQGLWLVGVGLMTLRLVTSVGCAYREAGRALAGLAPTHDLTRELCARMGVHRAVRVAAVERLQVPAVLGVIWPTILLPVALLGETSSEQLRFILAHELAHIRRHDYLVNLAQLAVEAWLFFNPAVWWISRRIRLEREARCDALAVEALGNPTGYARTLVNWAERERAFAPAALAFSSPRHQLRERVSRLLVGNHRPRLGVSPWSLLGLLLAGGLALAGLSSGTRMAVAVAAEIMSPTERIEKITEAEKQFAEPPLEEGPVKISGTLSNADGSPLSKKTQLQTDTLRRTANSSSSAQRTVAIKNSKFTDTVSSGQLWVFAQQPGYALAILGPVVARPSAPPAPFDLKFERGFTGQLLVIDEQGKPVANAKLNANQMVPAAGFYIHVANVTTNGLGQAPLEHLAHLDVAPLRVNLVAPGFQELKNQPIEVSADKVTTIRLKPTLLATGIVTYEANGQPAAGARIVTFQVNRRRPNHNESFSEASLLATCDAEGRFTLDTLSDDFSYDLVIEGTDGSRLKIDEVRAGDRNLQAKLPKPIVVRGTVLHPEKLPKDRMLHYSNHRMISGQTPVTVRDGVGHFEITGLLPPDLTIWTARGARMPVDLNGPLDNVVFDLENALTGRQTRQVAVRLVAPTGLPVPTGRLHVGTLSAGVPIENGIASFKVPPGTMYLSPLGMTGYWFPPATVEVTAGAETLEHTIDVRPAGAIAGTVAWLKPDPKDRPRLQVLTLEKSPQVQGGESYVPEVRVPEGSDRFLVSPLPLDGVYQVLLIHGATAVLSEPILVDEKEPLVALDLPRPETVDSAGTVTDPDGRPLVGARVSVEVTAQLNPNQSQSTNLSSTMTDDAGKFQFAGINRESRLRYTLAVSKPGYQPFVELKFDPTGQPTDIQLQAGHRLRLIVIDDATGNRVTDSVLQIHPPGDNGFPATRYERTNAQGAVDIDTLASGEMVVEVLGHTCQVPTDAETPFELHLNAGAPGQIDVRAVER